MEVFRSRYSVVLIIIILSAFSLVLRSLLQSPGVATIIAFLVFVIIMSIVSGINYVIEGDQLIFRTWSIENGRIDIHSIVKIERTYFPLASNAGSLKRLYGKTKKGSRIPIFLISPVNEKRFIEKLKQINQDIEIKVESKTGFFRFWDWDI
jgi:hypothetical protein